MPLCRERPKSGGRCCFRRYTLTRFLDVASPDSALRSARQGVDLASVLRLNREALLPFYPAAERTQDFGIGVLAQSIFYHEVSEIYNQLLTYGSNTCEIYILGAAEHEGHRADISPQAWREYFEDKTFA